MNHMHSFVTKHAHYQYVFGKHWNYSTSSKTWPCHKDTFISY